MIHILSYLDDLPQEIVEEVAVNLDCKSLSLLCQASQRLSNLCNNVHILKRMIRNKDYNGGLEEMNVKDLKFLCNLIGDKKFIPGQAFAIPNADIKSRIKVLDDVVEVSTGGSYSLCLTSNGRVHVLDEKKRPVLVHGLNNAVQVSSGGSHFLCLRADGQVYAFGDNAVGQLGLGDNKRSHNVVIIPDLNNIVQVSAGVNYSLCLTSDGQVYGFGSDSYGKLGRKISGPIYRPEFIPDLENIVQVSAGYTHSLCLRRDGRVYGFGNNISGESGNIKHRRTLHKLQIIDDLHDIVQVSTAKNYSLCLRADGKVYVFGYIYKDGKVDLSGRITQVLISVPEIIPGLDDIVQISTKGSYSLFLRRDRRVYIFKNNISNLDYSYLADESSVIASDVNNLTQVISAGSRYSLATTR